MKWLLAFVFSFLALTIFIWAENQISPSFQACISQKGTQTTTQNGEKNADEKSNIVVIVRSQALCSLRLVDRHNGFFSALAALIVAVFTVTLWISTSKQARLSFESLRLAREEFIATHRPKIIIRFIQGPFVENDHQFIWVTVVNVGASAGTIIGFGGDLARREKNGNWYTPGLTATPRDIENPIMLAAGERHNFTITAATIYNDTVMFADAVGDHQLCAVGAIRYRDGNGRQRETAFFRIYDEESDSFTTPAKDADNDYQD